MINNINIVPEKTAISNSVSNSCKMIVFDFNSKKEILSLMDYGCGRLRNSKYLIEEGFNVSVIDTEKQIENQLHNIKSLNIINFYTPNNINFENQYDIILLSFVLNVVPEIKDRDIILENIYKLLKDNGTAYIEVRNHSFLKNLKSAFEFKDGFLIGEGKQKTFQKPYTLDELSQYLISNKFKIIDNKKKSNSIIIKIKKEKVVI